MTTFASVIVEVEPPHLDRSFDYTVPGDLEHPVQVGSRVEVVFGGRRRRGLVVDLPDSPDVAVDRVRPLRRVLGPHIWMRPEDLETARWAAARFGAPLADVIRHALPNRTVEVERRAAAAGWFPPGTVARPSSGPPPESAALEAAWLPYGDAGRQLLDGATSGEGAFFWRPLPDDDVGRRIAELVQLTLAGDRDVLVVVPDPASPTADAVATAAGDLAVDVRGGPSPRVTYDRWLRARCGYARVVVGERGAVLWPLERLGLTVVLDEANPALKERRSPRHHAREVALERARKAGGVGLLVGLVPSAPAWRLLTERRLTPVVAGRKAERAAAPLVRIDRQEARPRTRIGHEALVTLRRAVDAGAYAVVLATRRGEGRALACTDCGLRVTCPTCGSSVARIEGAPRLHCEGCGWQSPGRPTCARCGSTRFAPLAAGAERLAEELARSVSAPVAVLEGYAAEPPPPPAVLVMTRGSVLDAPPGPVGGVVVPDLDGLLVRPALDAAEDALRLSMQVARWTVASREAERPMRSGAGRRRDAVTIVQTDTPDHHAVRALVSWDPGGFWREEAARRAPLAFPPAAFAIRLDVADADLDRVAADLADLLPDDDHVLGPVPRGGRAGFLIKSVDRIETVAALVAARQGWSRSGYDTRLDVDPVDVT